MAMLLRCLESGEPFVTYGVIRDELQHQFGIERIFSTQIGYVAGSLMNQILEVDENAPLINVLITRGDGIPGDGVGSYLAGRYGKPSLAEWSSVPRKKKLLLVERERELIFSYSRWREINETLFGESFENQLVTSSDENNPNITPGEYGGPAESEEHRALKEWVSQNPKSIGLARTYGTGDIEHWLSSGDEVDVMFQRDASLRPVEVKSFRSSTADLKRGIYQCVKYRAVKEAEHLPFEIDCKAYLVTETELPEQLKDRARVLGVVVKVLSRDR